MGNPTRGEVVGFISKILEVHPDELNEGTLVGRNSLTTICSVWFGVMINRPNIDEFTLGQLIDQITKKRNG